jgi:hypothetical protein
MRPVAILLLGLFLAAPPGARAVAPPEDDPARGRGQIRGEVTDRTGEPLIGISIVLAPQGNPHVLYATSTDDHGRYALNHLLSDTYEVRADGQGFEPLVKGPVQVRPPFRAIIDLEMEPRESPAATLDPQDATDTVKALEGRFVDAAGEPVLEGSVVFQRSGRPEEVFYGRTDRDGWFRIEDLPADSYDIVSRSPGLIPLHLVARALPPADRFHLRLVAPPYPLSFRGWLDDLLPMEIPVPPPLRRQVDWESLPAAGGPATDEPPAETTGEDPPGGGG